MRRRLTVARIHAANGGEICNSRQARHIHKRLVTGTVKMRRHEA